MGILTIVSLSARDTTRFGQVASIAFVAATSGISEIRRLLPEVSQGALTREHIVAPGPEQAKSLGKLH